MHYLKLGNDILIFCCFVSEVMLPSINPPAQRVFAVPINQLRVPNEFQQEQQLDQVRQQGQLLQGEQQQQQQPYHLRLELQPGDQQGDQQQQHVAEEQTLQPISFDRFSAMPIKEVLGIFNNPTGVIKKMPPRPQSGTVWRFDNSGTNKGSWKSQMYQWVEPSEKKLLEKMALALALFVCLFVCFVIVIVIVP